jgi:preprotein translocase subunit SecE
MFERASEFLKEVRVESTKITWPTRAELRESTIVVVITVSLISVFIAIVDRGVGFLVSLLI